MQRTESGCDVKGCVSWKPSPVEVTMFCQNETVCKMELSLCSKHRKDLDTGVLRVDVRKIRKA